MEERKTNTKKKTGLEIIIEYKDSLNSLIHFYSLYINLLTEIKALGEGIDKLEDEKKESVKNFCAEIRYHATFAYLKYKSLCTSLKFEKGKENKKLEESYSKIKDNVLLDDVPIMELIIEFNAFLMNEIIQELLKGTDVLLNELYGQNEGQ